MCSSKKAQIQPLNGVQPVPNPPVVSEALYCVHYVVGSQLTTVPWPGYGSQAPGYTTSGSVLGDGSCRAERGGSKPSTHTMPSAARGCGNVFEAPL